MTIPSNLRAPIFAAEFDSSRAQQGPAVLGYKGLLIGGRLSSGSLAEAVVRRVSSVDEVKGLAGRGSELAQIAAGWFAANRMTPTYICALTDAAAAVHASGTLVFAGPATAAGTVVLYIAGAKVSAAVASGDTAAAIAGALAEAVAAQSTTGTAAAGGASTITLAAGASTVDDAYNGMWISIASGTGSGQVRQITDYVGSTKVATVNKAWGTNPDVTSVYSIREDTDFPAVAFDVSGTVTFTAKNGGEHGNGLDIRLNLVDGDVLPAGVTTTPASGKVSMASGATNPDAQDIIDVLGDEWYQVIVGPYVDTTNLNLIKTELDSRNGSTRQIDGVYFSTKKGSLATLSTFGDGRNSRFEVIPEATDSVSSPAYLAGAIAGLVAYEGSVDPKRPFQTLQIPNAVPVPITERFTFEERNGLLFDGISTIRVDSAGAVRIDRLITTYQRNDAGVPNTAYLNLTTVLTLMYLRYDWNAELSNYARYKLADDGVKLNPGQAVMTPKLGKALAVSKAGQWEAMGLIQDVEAFKRDLVCVRSQSDRNRLEWILPPELLGELVVGATNIQFLL